MNRNDLLVKVLVLEKCVNSLIRKISVLMRFILMQEETEFVGMKDIRYRKDVVFSQAVCRFLFCLGFLLSSLNHANLSVCPKSVIIMEFVGMNDILYRKDVVFLQVRFFICLKFDYCTIFCIHVVAWLTLLSFVFFAQQCIFSTICLEIHNFHFFPVVQAVSFFMTFKQFGGRRNKELFFRRFAPEKIIPSLKDFLL